MSGRGDGDARQARIHAAIADLAATVVAGGDEEHVSHLVLDMPFSVEELGRKLLEVLGGWIPKGSSRIRRGFTE